MRTNTPETFHLTDLILGSFHIAFYGINDLSLLRNHGSQFFEDIVYVQNISFQIADGFLSFLEPQQGLEKIVN